MHANGTYDIDYDDGEQERRVDAAMARPVGGAAPGSPKKSAARLREGDAVEANFRGRGKFFKGKIDREHSDGTYDILFDDGDRDTRVEAHNIRSLDERPGSAKKLASARLREGDAITGNYRGKGRWYPGKIARERSDGTYDIAYDDGDSERGVKSLHVRKT